MNTNRLRRPFWLNRATLVAALVLAALGVATLLMQPAITLDLTLSPANVLILSAVWLLIAYAFGRAGRSGTSGWLVVILSIVWFALALYLLPTATLALLPAALLPVSFAALTLNRFSLIVVAVLTAALVLVVAFGLLPVGVLPAPPTVPLALGQLQLGAIVAAAAMGLLVLMLVPLRGAHATLTQQIAEHVAHEDRLAHEQQRVEQERDAALNLVARQVQHLEAIANQIRDGVISVNEQGEVVRANQAARELVADLIQTNTARPMLDAVETALATTPGDAPADVVPLPLFGLAPEQSFTHVLIDRREELRLARLRGELLGLLTDEMRNPLTSMVTALDLTLGQKDLPEEIDRVLIGARQSGQRLLDLVSILLDISLIEQNPHAMRRSATTLGRIIENGIAQMSPLAQRGAVTVAVENTADSPMLVDIGRVQRAFSFLLEQALRQSPAYSVVQIRSRRAEGQIVVQISDQGAGRTTHQSEHILRQSSEERSISSLGLIYTKLVIESHGGRVWTESSGGQGTSFSFALPLERQELLRAEA